MEQWVKGEGCQSRKDLVRVELKDWEDDDLNYRISISKIREWEEEWLK